MASTWVPEALILFNTFVVIAIVQRSVWHHPNPILATLPMAMVAWALVALALSDMDRA